MPFTKTREKIKSSGVNVDEHNHFCTLTIEYRKVGQSSIEVKGCKDGLVNAIEMLLEASEKLPEFKSAMSKAIDRRMEKK